MPLKKEPSSRSSPPAQGCKDKHRESRGTPNSDDTGARQAAQLTPSSVGSEKTRTSPTTRDCIHNTSSGDSLEDTTKVSEKRLSKGANVGATIEEAGRNDSLDSYRKYSRGSSFIKDLRAQRASMNFGELDYDATMKSANEEVG